MAMRMAQAPGGPACLPGVDLAITDPATGTRLARGQPGMIEVCGPNVLQRCWRMPAKARAELRENGFCITGDIGVVDAEGHVPIIARQKDPTIPGGYNVYPREIGMVLDARPGGAESAVVGVPDPDFGEAVMAVLVARPGAAPTRRRCVRRRGRAGALASAQAHRDRGRVAAQHHGQGEEKPDPRLVAGRFA